LTVSERCRDAVSDARALREKLDAIREAAERTVAQSAAVLYLSRRKRAQRLAATRIQ